MVAAAPWLRTRALQSPAHASYTPSAIVQEYKNLWVFTNPLGWPASGATQTTAGATPWTVHRYPCARGDGLALAHNGPLQAKVPATQSPLGYKDYPSPGIMPGPDVGRWLPMTVHLPNREKVFAATDTAAVPLGPHPHSNDPNLTTYRLKASDLGLPTKYSPYFGHPNTRSIPVPPYWYDATGGTALFGTSGDGTLVGVELPLSWRLSQYWGDDVYFVKLSIPGSFTARYDRGEPLIPKYSWYNAAEHYDWSPDTQRLFNDWYEKMRGAHLEAINDGDKLDVQLIALWQGDNDSSQEADRTEKFRDTYISLMKAMRQACADQDWTTLPPHQIRVLLMGVYKSYDSGVAGNPDRLNALLKGIADDDPYATWLDTDDYNNLVEDGYPNATGAGGHFGHTGYLDLADQMYDAYLELEYLADDAYGIDNRITREECRRRVLLYYERGTGATDATPDVVNMHMNAAMMNIINTVGDQAWWLRRILTMNLTGGPGTPVTLPKIVSRILRLETPETPTFPLQFEMLGYVGGGRLQIVLKERYVGTFVVHFFTQPRELASDGELIPLPHQLLDWLVTETARRLARSSGNIALQASLEGEVNRLQASSMRNMGAQTRARFDRLHTQRRLYGYGRMGAYFRNPFPLN
jgi:hypothetical protein